jgi:hypothetical protein
MNTTRNASDSIPEMLATYASGIAWVRDGDLEGFIREAKEDPETVASEVLDLSGALSPDGRDSLWDQTLIAVRHWLDTVTVESLGQS